MCAAWIPPTKARVSVLPKSIIAGKFDLSGRGLVIGSEFAQNLNLFVGDRVSIYSPTELKKMKEQRGKTNEEAILPDDYTVTGIFDVGYYDYDSSVVVTSLENAQDLYNLGDSVHGLMVMLHDPYQAPEVQAANWKPRWGRTTTSPPGWRKTPQFSARSWSRKTSCFTCCSSSCIVAALCILSAQITFVVQKTREIGMLKALGATNLQISGIFLSQSAIIGVLGVLAGYGLGILALTYRNEFLHFMNHLTGWELFPASIYGFSELPAVIDAARHRDHLRQLVCHLHSWRRAARVARRPVETRGGAAL